MSDRILNTPIDPHLDAKFRLSRSFRDICLEKLYIFAAHSKQYKDVREYFNQGGGKSWEDIIKAVEDGSPEGNGYLDLFRQLATMELDARGVYSPQVEKNIVWGEDINDK